MKYLFDCEFIEDGSTIDLISIGVVCEDGRELYMQNRDCDFARASGWVRENVLPHLTDFDAISMRPTVDLRRRCNIGDWHCRSCMGGVLRKFVGDDTPEWWGYYSAYDHVALSQLFGRMIDLPKGWPFLTRDIKQFAEDWELEGDFYQLVPQVGTAHNALDDARWTKLVWERLREMRAERERALLYVPGEYRCPECGLRVTKKVLRASDGAVGVDARAAREPCPNDGRELEPLTWKMACAEADVALGQLAERVVQLEEADRRLPKGCIEGLRGGL